MTKQIILFAGLLIILSSCNKKYTLISEDKDFVNPFNASFDGLDGIGDKVFYWNIENSTLSVIDSTIVRTIVLDDDISGVPFPGDGKNVYVPCKESVIKICTKKMLQMHKYMYADVLAGAVTEEGVLFLLSSKKGMFLSVSGQVISEFTIDPLFDTQVAAFSRGVVIGTRQTDILNHAALGDNIEPSTLEVLFSSGTKIELPAPDGYAFEEVLPDVVETGDSLIVITTISNDNTGAALMRFIIENDNVTSAFVSPALEFGWLNRIYTSPDSRYTWYVQQPHVTKHLIKYDWELDSLSFIVDEVSSHKYGSPNLRASNVILNGSEPEFLIFDVEMKTLYRVTDNTKRALFSLESPIITPLILIGKDELYLGTEDGNVWNIKIKE